MQKNLDIYSLISPLDYRYGDPRWAQFLSPQANVNCLLEVEKAHIFGLVRKRICSKNVFDEVNSISLSARIVYDLEKKTKHDIKALVDCIKRKVSKDAKPHIHHGLTSYDTICTGTSLQYQKSFGGLIAPDLIILLSEIERIINDYGHIKMIGRTHGQHGVPITVGFMFSGYYNRLKVIMNKLIILSNNLPGKLSGAVGNYSGLGLLINNPIDYEWFVLDYLHLQQIPQTSQIIPMEYINCFLIEIVQLGGVVANIANDLRHLQRSEIDEFREGFVKGQTGSSAMPHKKNPINLENVVSMWKVVVPKVITLLLNQVSEHQRDLTDSVGLRANIEILAYVDSMINRATRTLKSLVVNEEALERNLKMSGDFLVEPLYILLQKYGHPKGHEVAKKLAMKSRENGISVIELMVKTKSLIPYYNRMTDKEKAIVANPMNYTGYCDVIVAKTLRPIMS